MKKSREHEPIEGSTQATLDLGTVEAQAAFPLDSVDEDLPADRYTIGVRIGSGASGEVHAAQDRWLGREVALKILHARLQRLPAAIQRLRAEARLVASLEHPGVVPIHDVGALPDGRLYFAMKRVEGDELDVAWREASLRRRVQLVSAVAQTVAYAHGRGVVHRDLKPSNVMVGAFGEVWVLDWGLARYGEPGTASLAGTPAWMAPEQVGGASVGPPSDVWALGGLLYLALTGRGIHAHRDVTHGELIALLSEAGEDCVPPVPTGVDPDLARVAMRALSVAPERRPTADELLDDLSSWLDGARRRARAEALVDAAISAYEPSRALEQQARQLRSAARAALDALPADASDDQREPWWEQHARAEQLHRDGVVAHARYVQALQGALSVDPEAPRAHRLLAEEHARAHADAERRGDEARAASVMPFLAAHDREGRWAAYRRGTGTVSLATAVPARVDLFQYVLHRRRWYPTWLRSLGTTPLVDLELPIGSYHLSLRADGHAALDLPFVVRRLEHVDLGGPSAQPLPIPRADRIGPHDCAVPPGWFECGTGVPSGHPLPRRRLWGAGFVMQRQPITNADWLLYLDDLHRQGRHEEARARGPLDADGTPVHRETPDGWRLGADREGHAWEADHPVVRVAWDDARAYAAWRAERDGLPWRLPWELEWVQAARGADYRIYPWGDAVEVTWARMVGSPGPEGPHSIHAYPSDTSPYGVRHLGGQASCWLLDAFPGGAATEGDRVVAGSEPPPSPTGYRMLRGGAWRAGAGTCRADRRKAGPAISRSETVGIRLVRPWPVEPPA